MKINKKLKRLIMGSVGFTMAVVVFFMGSMQSMRDVTADVRVFDRITERYPDTDAFKMNILEIVPDDPTYLKEMGYFIKKQDRQGSPAQPTHGTIHSKVNEEGPYFATNTGDVFADTLYALRTYGMVRPLGGDTTGIYPIYVLGNGGMGITMFSNYATTQCPNPYKFSFVKGVYEMAPGNYNIATGYAIDENGQICKVNIVPFVSGNGIVSENNPNYDEDTNTIKQYVPVKDVIQTEIGLPRSVSVNYITEAAEAGKGNVKFTRSETVTNKVEYYGHSDQTLYYFNAQNNYFYSSDYFKEYVLGSKTKYAERNITYNTVKASEVTVTQVNDADLIYISGQSTAFAKCDISEDVMLEIYNKEVNEHKAVMMDYACYSADATTNVSKLAVLLWRGSQSEIAQKYTTAYTDEKNPTIMKNVDFLTGDALADLKASMETGAEGNFVVGNVYVYNHHMSDFEAPKSMVDALDNFANGDFNSLYKTSVVQKGFSSVLSYITATNKNSTTGGMLASVTPAVAIQYILISDGNPLTFMKSRINVLEIQPVMSFLFNDTRGSEEYGYLGGTSKDNRDYFITTYLNNYYDDKQEDITFTSMTVDEFNGRNEDLVENYDIIYIGSEQGSFYFTASMITASEKDGKYDTTTTQSKNLPSYNDGNMNGNVYYNIGDTIKVDKDRLMRFLDDDTTDARFAGRDITKDKLNKLKEYLEKDNLILVEGDLYAEGEVNPTAVANGDRGRMDNSSNMYELIQYARGYRFNPGETDATKMYQNASGETAYPTFANLVSVKDIVNKTVDKATIEKYVATEKLMLTLLDQPRQYSYTLNEKTNVIDKITYMEEEADGTRALKYNFVISSDLANKDGVSTYRPHLYVDVNNDGKYSKTSEDIRDIKIIAAGTGEEAERDTDNNYILYKDVEYEMSRDLDDSFSGYIRWKLSVESNQYKNSHASEQGSTVVKNKGKKELIKILQITNPELREIGRDNQNNPIYGPGSTLDLEEQENDETSLYGKYLAAVPGYDVEIKTITLTEFADDFDAKWKKYNDDYDKAATDPDPANRPKEPKMSLQKYALYYFENTEIVAAQNGAEAICGADMIVLGFGDNFPSIQSADAIAALQTYMDNENPVLMAHDFIMYWAKIKFYNGKAAGDNVPALHGYYLRHNAGMDKYGVTQNIVKNTTGNVTAAELISAAVNPNTGFAYLHSGENYTRGEDSDVINLIEATGKAVAYQPAGNRRVVLKETQGISATTLMRFRDKDSTSKWLNADGASTQYYGRGSYEVDKINDGQITSFPYILPDNFTVNGTHAQYFQLDMEADHDDDGESDVVVWYTLGEYKSSDINATYDPYGPKAAGPVPAEGYYIYNKGNITYTGAGDSYMANENEKSTNTEAQLFVNTLFAAYNAAKVRPSTGFFEEVPKPDTKPIHSIVIPYDKNVTADDTPNDPSDDKPDSSILKDTQGEYRYKFVSPDVDPTTVANGTPIYFRLSDTNFVRGMKYMEIEYYLKVNGAEGETYTLNKDKTARSIEMLSFEGTSVPVVNISNLITTYNVSNGAFSTVVERDATTKKLSLLENGVVYGFYPPLAELENNSQVTIYIKSKTRIYTVSSQTGQESIKEVAGEGVDALTFTKTDLLDLK